MFRIQMHARSGQDGHSTTGQSRFSNKNDVPQRLTRQFDPTIFAPSSVILIFIRKLEKKSLNMLLYENMYFFNFLVDKNLQRMCLKKSTQAVVKINFYQF
jgi:hypothetical protein